MMRDALPTITDQELEQFEREHEANVVAGDDGLYMSGRTICSTCGVDWPCQMVRLVIEVRRGRERSVAADDEQPIIDLPPLLPPLGPNNRLKRKVDRVADEEDDDDEEPLTPAQLEMIRRMT
jgi:hypothetical protein